MKNKSSKKIILMAVTALIILIFPLSLSAAEPNEGYEYYQAGWEVIPNECIDPNTVDLNGVIKRCDANSFVQLFVNLANIMLKLSPPLAMIIVIYGGFRFLTARGNQESVQSGKKVLVGAFIGMFLIIGFGWAISFFVVQTLTGNEAGKIFATTANPTGQAWWSPNPSESEGGGATSLNCCVVEGNGCAMKSDSECTAIGGFPARNTTNCNFPQCQTIDAKVNCCFEDDNSNYGDGVKDTPANGKPDRCFNKINDIMGCLSLPGWAPGSDDRSCALDNIQCDNE